MHAPSWLSLRLRPFSEEGQQRIQRGIQKGIDVARSSHIAVCIILRDEAESIRRNMPELLGFLRAYFCGYKLFIVENDSTDDTRPLLHSLQSQDRNVHCKLLDLKQKHSVQHCHGTEKNCTSRGQLLADLRNTCMQWALSSYEACDYVLVLDIDYMHIWFPGVLHSLGLADRWDVVCANSMHMSPLAFTYDSASFSTFQMFAPRIDRALQGPYCHCFGSMSLYKADLVSRTKATYGTKTSVIEHVQFVHGLRTKRVFMNPAMVIVMETELDLQVIVRTVGIVLCVVSMIVCVAARWKKSN